MSDLGTNSHTLDSLRSLSTTIATNEEARGVENKSHVDESVKRLIATIDLADRQVSQAMANYGYALKKISEIQSAHETMKPIATVEARQAVSEMLFALSNTTKANIYMHEKLMKLGDNHSVAMLCCGGK